MWSKCFVHVPAQCISKYNIYSVSQSWWQGLRAHFSCGLWYLPSIWPYDHIFHRQNHPSLIHELSLYACPGASCTSLCSHTCCMSTLDCHVAPQCEPWMLPCWWSHTCTHCTDAEIWGAHIWHVSAGFPEMWQHRDRDHIGKMSFFHAQPWHGCPYISWRRSHSYTAHSWIWSSFHAQH